MHILKGQISIEFMILLMIVFTAFIAFYKGSYEYKIDVEQKKEETIAKDILFKIREEVLIAQNSMNGYSRSFRLPEVLSGSYDYSINITNNILFVITDNAIVDVPIPSTINSINPNQYNFTITRINDNISITSQ